LPIESLILSERGINVGVKKIGFQESDASFVEFFIVFHKKGGPCKISAMPRWENRSPLANLFLKVKDPKKAKNPFWANF
jgi:hypothetical protein